MQALWTQSIEDLARLLKEWGYPAYRARQIHQWIFKSFVVDPQKMENLPLDLRQRLQGHFLFPLPTLKSRLDSEDGASKLLLEGGERKLCYEAVVLRYPKRVSLCVSSQVGCKLACLNQSSAMKRFAPHMEYESHMGF